MGAESIISDYLISACKQTGEEALPLSPRMDEETSLTTTSTVGTVSHECPVWVGLYWSQSAPSV